MRRDPAVAFLALGQTLVWASIYYVFPALLLRWEQELGWTKAELTLAITMAVFVSAAVSPLTGRLIDKGYGAVMMALSALLGGLGLVGLSVVTELWQFQAVWLMIGLAMGGCLYEPCFAIVTRARGADAKQAIILITLAAGFASTISFPALYSLSEALGWRAAVQIVAGLVITAVAPLLYLGARLLERRSPAADTRPEGEQNVEGHAPSSHFLKTTSFWFLALGFACLAIAHGALLHHLLPFLDEAGVAPELAVLAASFVGPMQVAGRIAMLASERVLSHHGVALAAFGIIGFSVPMLYLSGTSLAFLSLFILLFGGAYGTVSILRPLLARDILGEVAFGAKSGALALPYLAGSASAPYLGSLIWGIGGYDLMLASILAVTLTGGLLYGRAARAMGRKA
ncbi:MFS transporter [Coralliovum pocilloporae]|uniref:MFS transporter n=1 Tax=Coralliovum pocilloporae TaxID=3066369 RepID=UPI003306E6B0